MPAKYQVGMTEAEKAAASKAAGETKHQYLMRRIEAIQGAGRMGDWPKEVVTSKLRVVQEMADATYGMAAHKYPTEE